MDLSVLIALGLLGFIGGVGITTVGPGGVLPTIALFTLTDLTPAQVAGTAIVTHVATGVLGTAAYTRSGQLREPGTRRTALILSATALFGTPLGVVINTSVSKQAFGLVLAVFVAGVAALVWYRDRHEQAATMTQPPTGLVAVLGLAVAVAAGIVGIGGPMLTVPLLVALGLPVLESVASAQVQSIVIAAVGTVGYLGQGAIDWPLAALVGIPELAGVLLGWKIAHALPTRTLKRVLIVTLFALAPYLALHS
ncbi:sulfite exporter TauE/SafE family protein [Streptomyces sp. TP-A0874]|uniref:sulfite exporter TauE/SafE family protein n=1 Tax=Streptomyces sp. TP-A0874 TaxID=549819 RepID=UPI001FCD3EC4|nr:sulfite exporter TauE/SafE family protein [Streptomyces sp. TP-A0874]